MQRLLLGILWWGLGFACGFVVACYSLYVRASRKADQQAFVDRSVESGGE